MQNMPGNRKLVKQPSARTQSQTNCEIRPMALAANELIRLFGVEQACQSSLNPLLNKVASENNRNQGKPGNSSKYDDKLSVCTSKASFYGGSPVVCRSSTCTSSHVDDDELSNIRPRFSNINTDSEPLTSGNSEWTTATHTTEENDTPPEIQRTSHNVPQPNIDFSPPATMDLAKLVSGDSDEDPLVLLDKSLSPCHQKHSTPVSKSQKNDFSEAFSQIVSTIRDELDSTPLKNSAKISKRVSRQKLKDASNDRTLLEKEEIAQVSKKSRKRLTNEILSMQDAVGNENSCPNKKMMKTPVNACRYLSSSPVSKGRTDVHHLPTLSTSELTRYCESSDPLLSMVDQSSRQVRSDEIHVATLSSLPSPALPKLAASKAVKDFFTAPPCCIETLPRLPDKRAVFRRRVLSLSNVLHSKVSDTMETM